MSVVAAGVMCYLTMDKRLVEVLKTITLATYQPFLFLIVIDFVYSFPTLSKIIHCLVVSLTCTKFNEQNSRLRVYRTNGSVLCKKNVTKILWLKKSCSRMLWKTESKVLVWPKILFKCLLFCLWKIWISKIRDSIYRTGLEGSQFLKFLYWPKFSLCWVICAFHLEQYWTKISLFIPRLNAKVTDWPKPSCILFQKVKSHDWYCVALQFVFLLLNDNKVLFFLMRCYLTLKLTLRSNL